MVSHKLQEDPASPGDKRTVLSICLFLVAAVFLVFGQTLRYAFVNYDDSTYVLGDSPVTKGLTLGGIGWAFTNGYSANWHPLTWISHMLDYQLYGLNAGGHHLTNVLLHAATAILLFLVLRRMTGALWPGAFVAVVFAIHPLRAESVAWVSERKDVLSGLFFMLTLLMYVQYVEGSKGRGPKAKVFYGLTLLFFALGLMSKPMLVTLPFVLLLLDYWPLGRFTFPSHRGAANFSAPSAARLVFEKLPLFLLAAASSVITFIVQKNSGAMATLENIALPLRLANGLVSYVVYIFQMLWPSHLAVFYPYLARGPGWEMAGAGALLLFTTVLAVVFARRLPYLLVGWLWFLGMLVPVIGIVQVGGQARADRYTYLPQIGLYLLAAWGMRDLTASWRHRRQVLGAGALTVITVLIVCAWRQTSYWRNSESLWIHTLACTPDNAVAHRNLGDVFVMQGRSAEAIEQFQQVIKIKPDDAEAHYNLGVAFASQGRDVEAVEHYRKAIQFNPDHAEAHNNLGSLLAKQERPDEAVKQFQQAVRIKPDYIEARYNLGIALASQGRFDEAAGQFRKAIQFKPDYVAAHHNLGNMLAVQGRLDEAIGHYRRALELKPDFVQAHYRLGVALQAQRNFGAAITEYRKVLELDPKQLPVHIDLAWLLATCPESSLRNGSGAIELARQAGQLSDGEFPQILDTLAAAYAESGQFPKAVETARRAIDLANAQHNSVMAEVIRTRLQLYEANSPYHEKP
jgi:tetratricopeptide (TPR) repeat protein